MEHPLSIEVMFYGIFKKKKHQLKNGNIMAFVDCKDHDGSFLA